MRLACILCGASEDACATFRAEELTALHALVKNWGCQLLFAPNQSKPIQSHDYELTLYFQVHPSTAGLAAYFFYSASFGSLGRCHRSHCLLARRWIDFSEDDGPTR